MLRLLLFIVLAAAAVGYAAWIYRRFELRVPGVRWLTLVRAAVLVTILALLFDPKFGGDGAGSGSARWVLLDASLSMTAGAEGSTAWEAARARAEELESEGWRLVRFGDGAAPGPTDGVPSAPTTLLAPALERAAEAGAREVRVLSDLRFEDVVSVRADLQALPLAVDFERFGADVVNVGISSFVVPDAPKPEGSVEGRLEFHGTGVDSATVEVRADGELIASTRVAVPAAGLRGTETISLPVPETSGRLRYSATVQTDADRFASDDAAVAYASIGYEDGALVLLSLVPDWEPRFLLPLLGEVTGLSAVGYLRAGPDRYVPIGPAVDRGQPIDSATVRRAVRDAEFVVVHGLHGEVDAWTRALVAQPGRSILLPIDDAGAGLAGVPTRSAAGGEWYASGDLPPSPITGELSGATLLGLPPLTDVLVPLEDDETVSPVLVQLRGTGIPQAAFHLDATSVTRRVVGLSSGTWRWAMRAGAGDDAYRRLWSGLAGWVLADQTATAPEPRPARWVFDRGQSVTWRLLGDSASVRLDVSGPDGVVADTVVSGASASLGPLDPGSYEYRALDSDGQLLAEGRFDVSGVTEELLPRPQELEASAGRPLEARVGGGQGTPLRTSPWPYLLLILLLCGEWIARRRTGLR